MDRIVPLPERKLEALSLAWNESGMQPLVLARGRGCLTKETEKISSRDKKRNSQMCCCLGSQGKRQLSTLWGTGEPRLHLDLVNQVTGAGDRDKWLDLGH